MDLARTIARWMLVKPLWVLLGRQDLVRLARFLSNEARLDLTNAMEANGELLVQEVVVEAARTSGALTALDVGANVGAWTRHLVHIAQRAGLTIHIHAFEPCAGTAETLNRNLEDWGIATAVRVNQAALSSEVGECLLHSYGDNAGRNSLHSVRGEPAPHIERIRATTLDIYVRDRSLAHIDLLKIDAEGHDLEVLAGGQDLLRQRAVSVVQFEYNHRWIASRHYLADAFDLFGPLGYTIGKVTPRGIEFYERWHPELETFREGNYVAVRCDLMNRFPVTRWWNECR
jgi:FkbM family methyltransferase